jgi:hypothetical protein
MRLVPNTDLANTDLASATQVDALFASALQRSDEPTARQVEQAIAASIQTFGDQGCAARVAQEYGDHPETAVVRMRWARSIAAGTVRASNVPAGTARSARCMPAVRRLAPARRGQTGRALAAIAS